MHSSTLIYLIILISLATAIRKNFKIKGIVTPNEGTPLIPFPTNYPQTSLPFYPAPFTSPITSGTFATQPPLSSTNAITSASFTSGLADSKCAEYNGNKPSPSDIIVYVYGGTPSLQNEFPHMAALGYGPPFKVQWLCGGSLISEQYVITAAHCIVSIEKGEVTLVRLGATTLTSPQGQDYSVINRIVHPEYRPPILYHDIALLKLDRQVMFSDSIAPICLQTSRNIPNTFIATGWGKIEDGSQSNVLLKVNLDYYSNGVCNQNYLLTSKEYLPNGVLDDDQICAGSYQEDKDTCQGDSGGPLQIKSVSGNWVLVGITSFGRGCGVANSPGVYTRISNYISWIENIVWQ